MLNEMAVLVSVSPSPSPTHAPAGGEGGVSLADVANMFTIGGFVVAAAAIWFAGRQLRWQAIAQRLNAILETNRLWWDAPTVRATTQASAVLSGRTLDLVVDVYRHVIADHEAAIAGWPEPHHDAAQGVPYLLATLFPAGTDAATTESAYRRAMLDRARCVGLVLTVLSRVADGADVSSLLPSGQPPPDVAAAVQADLRGLQDTLDRYVGALNEVVELYGARMIDRRLFLGKRHISIIQQAFVAEPYVLWRNTVYGGRWGMRVLSIGQAARAYHWSSPLHARASTGTLALRTDPDGYGRGAEGEAPLCERVGAIVAVSAVSRWRGLLPRWTRRTLAVGFSARARKSQNKLVTRVLGPDQHGIDAWIALAANPDAQRERRLATSPVTMTSMADLAFEHVTVPEWETDAADPSAECIAQIDAWTASHAMCAVVEVFGGEIPRAPLQQRLEYLDEFSAAHWDFRRGRERNLVEAPEADDRTVEVVLAAATALGLGSDSPPRRRDYDAILVLGGLIRACLIRPQYAARLVSAGITTREVTALGGFRRLAGDELVLAIKHHLHDDPDEFWAMEAGMRLAFGPLPEPVVDRQDADNPNASSLVHTYRVPDRPRLRVIAAPSTDPANRRANSKDTYAFWAEKLADLPPSPHVLLVTTSIYVPYQGCAAIEALGVDHGIGVETVGTSMDSDLFADDPQQFLWFHYLQEIRSAVRGIRSLHARLVGTTGSAGRTTTDGS